MRGLLLLLLSSLLSATAAGAKKLNFFQISDLHLDTRYSEAGSVGRSCHLLDDVGVGLSPAGDYGCDAPLALVESAIRHMKTVNPHPDFILWSGDSSPHWFGQKAAPDIAYVTSNLKNITKLFRKYFDGSVPIVPALGNHDTSPPDHYPDPKVDKASSLPWYSQYIEEGSWGDLIPKGSQDDFKKCGFYVYPLDKVKFLVLNTNLYYYNEERLDGQDPCGQLEWLRKQLDEIADDEQAFVMAHVPPGYFERDLDVARPSFTIKNNTELSFDIMKRYVDIFTNKTNARKVTYHFYGHIHLDVFRLFMGNLHQAVGVGFVAPSVTPAVGWGFGNHTNGTSHGTNPSHRIYTYDTETRTMDDYVSYYLDLKEVNEAKGTQVPEAAAAAAGADRSARNSKFSAAFRKETRLRRAEPPLPVDNEDDNFTEAVTVDSTEEDVASTASAETVTATTPIAGSDNGTSEVANRAAEATTTTPSTTSTAATTTTTAVPLPDPSSPHSADLAKRWKKGYSAAAAFNSSDLSPKEMQGAYMDMVHHPEGPTFTQYFKHNTMFHEMVDGESCDEACHHDSMCAIAFLRVEDMKKCLGVTDEQMQQTGIDFEAETEKPAEPPNVVTDVLATTTTTAAPAPAVSIVTTAATTQKAPDEAVVVHDSPAKSELPSSGGGGDDGGTLSGVAIGFSVVLVLALAVGGLFLYRKVQSNRYRSQEFLLTDSIFRYDGYSHVDGP